MTTILKGQFFKEIVATKDTVVEWGWTVLWVEAGGDGSGGPERIVVIRNDTRSSAPVWFAYDDVIGKIGRGDWLQVDAPIKRFVSDAKLSGPAGAKIIAEQRKRLMLIKPILDLGRDAFFERPRTKALKAIGISHRVSHVSVYRYLCLYWQFGMRPEGLRPRHTLTGARPLQTKMELLAKNGKLSEFKALKPGRRPSRESEPGIAMQPRDVNLCRKGARMFLFNPSPDHALRYTWTTAHLETLNLFYGRKTNPAAPAPTLRQFKRAVRTDADFAKLSQKIIGTLPFARNHRQLKSTSRSEVLGPGQIGAIDDMTTKVILVDEITRLPLGTARVFAIVDVWSKLIVGAHDTLGGSSFTEAMEAMFNAFRDKADFAREQDLELDLKFIPARGVFATIEADNGPLKGTLADSLPESICDIANTTSYRPDMKADVESSFHAYLKQHAETLPGYNRIDRVRGDDDPKYLAYLTPREFRILLWKWIELYNQRPLRGMLPTEALRSENPPDPTPYQLWNWGILNCTGHLRYVPDDELRLKLLARDEATLTTRRGINFKGLTYLFNDGTQEENSVLLEPRRINVRFDHKYVRSIFVEHEGRLLVAKLRSDLDADFGLMTFAQVAKIKSRIDERRRAIERDYRRNQGKLLARKTEIAADAKKQTDEKYLSNAQRKRVIRSVSIERSRDSEMQRQQEAHAAKVESIFDCDREKKKAKPAPTEAPKPPANGVRNLSAMELLEE